MRRQLVPPSTLMLARRDAQQKAELQAEEKRRKLLNFNFAEDVRYRRVQPRTH
jgi:hypothetical protein